MPRRKNNNNMIIAIDFDGTIANGPYPQINGAKLLAKKTIMSLALQGHYIIINTCRSGDLLLEAINWLLEQGIPFNRVNDNEPASVDKYGTNSRKIYAHAYIDDKNIGGFPGWPQVFVEIQKIEQEWQQLNAPKSSINHDLNTYEFS